MDSKYFLYTLFCDSSLQHVCNRIFCVLTRHFRVAPPFNQPCHVDLPVPLPALQVVDGLPDHGHRDDEAQRAPVRVQVTNP